MRAVSDIRPSRRRNRVNVFLDGEFWTAMSTDCLADLQLTVGTRLSSADVDAAEARVAETEALGYCLRVLAARPRTSAQVREGLRRREFSETVIAEALRRCEELLLIDDAAYAQAVVEDRLERGYGLRRIQVALTDAGISSELAQVTIDEHADEDRLMRGARQALRQKFSGPQSPRERQRAVAYLLRRGFDIGQAQAAIAVELEFTDERADLQPQSRAVDLRQLAAEVSRKYPGIRAGDVAARRRAWGWLARRGLRGEQIHELLSR